MADIEQITSDLEKFCSTQEKQSQEFASPSKFSNIPGQFLKIYVDFIIHGNEARN